MWCRFVETGDENMKDALAQGYPYVIVLSRYQGRLLLSRHGKRTTWETQGGHIEEGETPLEAARRELYEESGALAYSIRHLFDCQAGDDEEGSKGMVFFAEITKLGPIPDSEMAQVQCFDALPPNITYPGITPVLYERACEMGLFGGE